jgi:Asp-tRNA(Asn)/Glu-tRNA(Gln) amidotransferase A subunit family amidase
MNDRTHLRVVASALALASAASLASVRPVGAQQLAPLSFEVVDATIAQLQQALTEGRVTAVQLVDAYLARIAAYDTAGPRLNAIIAINPGARVEAESLDRERARGATRGPLHGIPVLLKDNFDAQGMATTAGSLGLTANVPRDDAFQVRRLKEAGAIILGKTNLHELASGITTISALGGQTRNPYDPSRNPGGSSGGTGAAIAASFAAVGWGTDTCGSIRIPASHNNLVGLRPTRGLSSTDGIVPLSHTQDVAGPLARSVADLAVALDATVGFDPADSATLPMQQRPPPRFAAALDAGALRGARIGVLESLFGGPADDAEMIRLVRAAIDAMKEQGADIVTIEIANLDSLIAGSGLIDHEFKFDLADFLAASPGAMVRSVDDILRTGLYHVSLGERLRRRNAAATRDTEAALRARARRSALREATIAMLESSRVDALVYPTMRRRPAIIDEPQAGSTCSLSAQTGLPALTSPAGFTNDGLPAGIELLGRPFDDVRLLSLAYAFEQATHHRRPPLTTPPLVDGHAPIPIVFGGTAGVGTDRDSGRVAGDFTFDITRSELTYDVTLSGVDPAAVYAIVLMRAATASAMPAVALRLSGPGRAAAAGTITLTAADRDALIDGRLMLAALTRSDPAGATRVRLNARSR